MNDKQGLLLTTSSEGAARSYNDAVTQLLDYRVTAMPSVKQALVDDENFCMGHCLRGYMLMMYSTVRFHGAAQNALAAARGEANRSSPREQAHVEALASWVCGDLHMACARWECILVDHPLDILALRLHHFVSFWMGRSQALVKAPAAVLAAWTKGMPNRGNVLGMLAFGLEEAGQTKLAERYGREAVDLNPNDLWAVHSVAHVLETEHRFEDGLRWTDFPRDHWEDRNPFRGHLWWHRGLFLLEAGRFDEAMALYDGAIYDTKSDFYLDIQNAAAFLARVEFRGRGVGERWEVLAQHAQANLHDHVLPFTDLHCVMALAHTGRHGEARAYIESMRTESVRNEFHVAQVLRRVAIPISEAILSLEKGHSDQALFSLIAAKPMLAEVGASNAQRDLMTLYTIEAAKRTGSRQALEHQLREHDFVTRLGWTS
ncbi:tetratricopeptide repeat protein [Pseudorhodoferax soli]|nr:tetratricopeptide repeat protein [Pseudorhodoferax soli]